MPPRVRVDPAALIVAAARLDAVAARLQAGAMSTGYALRPLPSGSEEVSVLAARHFTSAATSFERSAGQAVAELFEAAAALRVQAEEYRQVDEAFASALAPAAGSGA